MDSADEIQLRDAISDASKVGCNGLTCARCPADDALMQTHLGGIALSMSLARARPTSPCRNLTKHGSSCRCYVLKGQSHRGISFQRSTATRKGSLPPLPEANAEEAGGLVAEGHRRQRRGPAAGGRGGSPEGGFAG